MMQEVYSIVMSCFNDEKYIKHSIESMLNQTEKKFEFIIVDDASTDQTLNIIANYKEMDSRIILIKNEKNIGLAASLNKAIKCAKAKWIVRMDGDDIAHLERLEKLNSFINKGYNVIGSTAITLNGNGEKGSQIKVPLDNVGILKSLKRIGTALLHPSVCFNKEAFDKVGGYNEMFKTAQDYDLWIRMSKIGSFINIDQDLMFIRKHMANISQIKTSEQHFNALISLYHYEITNQTNPITPTEYKRYIVELDIYLKRKKYFRLFSLYIKISGKRNFLQKFKTKLAFTLMVLYRQIILHKLKILESPHNM